MESAKMCAIYESATITVASASSSKGCFSEAKHVDQGFKMPNLMPPNLALYLRREPRHYEQPPGFFTCG